MRFMLAKKGFSSDSIDSCVEKLEEWGYIDDASLSRNILAAMLKNSPCGKRRCFYELEKRRFSKELIDSLVEDVYRDLDERVLATAAAKQYAKNKVQWTLKDLKRLARWLSRRGFTGEAVFSAVSAFGSELEAE